jgi:hypothetical protein
MHPTLALAMETAEKVMLGMTSGSNSPASELARLKKLSKDQLIAELMALKVTKMKDCKVEDLVYAIMCTPECAALSYKMIEAIVVKYRPGKTNEGNIRWYASMAIEKGIDTRPRIARDEFNKMLMSSIG